MENLNGTNLAPQSPQSLPSPKRWYRRKGVIAIVILAIIASISVWVYETLNQPQNLSPIIIQHKIKQSRQPIVTPAKQPATSTPAQTDITNWQTYKDVNQGFQIQYPAGWIYSADTSDPKSPVVRFYPADQTIGNGYGGDFILDTLSNAKKLDLKTFYQGRSINNFTKSATQTPLTINGYPAEEFFGTYDEIASDIISVNLGQTVIELTDVAQQHANDGMMTAMANSINLLTGNDNLSQPTTVKEVLVKAGVDVSTQQDATFDFRVANGHYLLWTYENNAVIYDGKKVYQGNVDSIGLNKNGLHYAYAIQTNQINSGWGSAYAKKDDDLYLDGKKIISNQNIQSIAISDDGQHYMFVSTVYTSGYIASANTNIYKDGQSVYQAQGINDDLNMSSDGSSYLATISPTGSTVELVNNGQLMPKGLNGFSTGAASNLVYSPNNKHYAYSTPTAIMVDGQTKYKLNGNLGGCLQITDLGHYALCDYAGGGFVVDGKLYPNPNVGGGGVSINISSDAAHYLTFDSQKWSLDGKTVTFKTIDPQWQQYAVDVVGNTFYVYSLVK